MDLFIKFTSIFLDSFTGLMPYFLLGLILSALVEVFVDANKIKTLAKKPIISTLLLSLAAFILPVANGGILPLARRLYQKGTSLNQVLFLLTAAPVVNFFTFRNSVIAFGFGNLVWLRFGLGWGLALVTMLLFSQVKVEAPEPIDGEFKKQEVDYHSRWQQFILTMVSDCFEWLPLFIGGSLLASFLRVVLPLSDWMNAAAGAPMQIITAMLYGVVLSISSTVNSLVVLNWLGRFPLAAILAFLMAGSIVDVRGLVMLIKGLGIKTSLYWVAFILTMIFISVVLIQLGLKG